MCEYEESMTVHENCNSLTTHNKAYIKKYDEVWFHKNAITNILSLKGLQSKFHVTYSSAYGSECVVHKPKSVNVQFTMRAYGLY